MTAKERLIRDVLELDEAQAHHARIVVSLEPDTSEEEPQPPFSLIGAFRSGRGDLGRLASSEEFERGYAYEPEPPR